LPHGSRFPSPKLLEPLLVAAQRLDLVHRRWYARQLGDPESQAEPTLDPVVGDLDRLAQFVEGFQQLPGGGASTRTFSRMLTGNPICTTAPTVPTAVRRRSSPGLLNHPRLPVTAGRRRWAHSRNATISTFPARVAISTGALINFLVTSRPSCGFVGLGVMGRFTRLWWRFRTLAQVILSAMQCWQFCL
jgi:hypothetical protein